MPLSSPSTARARESSNVAPHRRSVRVQAQTLDVLLDRGLVHSSARVQVELDLAELKPIERKQWRERIEPLYNACGCGVAAAFLVASLPVLVIVFMIEPGGLSLLTLPGLVTLAAIPVFATIAGKVIGLAYARRELRRAVDELSSLVASRNV